MTVAGSWMLLDLSTFSSVRIAGLDESSGASSGACTPGSMITSLVAKETLLDEDSTSFVAKETLLDEDSDFYFFWGGFNNISKFLTVLPCEIINLHTVSAILGSRICKKPLLVSTRNQCSSASVDDR